MLKTCKVMHDKLVLKNIKVITLTYITKLCNGNLCIKLIYIYSTLIEYTSI